MNSGTEQSDRLPAALKPGYFVPDEFSLAQRMRLSLAHAALLNTLGPDLNAVGNWGDALGQDEAILLAEIAAFPVQVQLDHFMTQLPLLTPSESWAVAQALLIKLDQWHHRLAHRTYGQRMAAALLRLIEQDLAPLLAQRPAAFSVSATGPAHPDGHSRTHVMQHPAWRLAQPTSHHAAEQHSAASDAPDALQAYLRKWMLTLARAITSVQALAQEQLSLSLKSRDHEPAVGLLLTALQLVQGTRGPINAFPDRLTDFYYRDVLRMREQPRRVEQVHLLLALDPSIQAPVKIEAGTVFLAGKDSAGAPIEFSTDQSIELARVQVAALNTLRLERDPLISPERELGYVTRIKAEQLPLLNAPEGEGNRPRWWPLLGGQAQGSAANSADARMGLAITSPLLLLKEGQRDITLRLRWAHPAQRDPALRQLLSQPPNPTPQWVGKVFARYEEFERALDASAALTTPPCDALALANQACQRSPLFEADVYLAFLMARCLAAADEHTFQHRCGRLLSAWLCAATENLRAADLEALRSRALKKYNPPSATTTEVPHPQLDDPLYLLYGTPGQPTSPPERELLFDRVFGALWQVQVSVAEGWRTVERVYVQRAATQAPATSNTAGTGGGMAITLRLAAEHPPLVACNQGVHGAMWPTQAALQLKLRSQTRVFSYSLLQHLELQSLGLEVQVQGLQDVRVYNQLARIDPSKPFAAFGPLPDARSYLILGSPEMAAKPLDDVQVHLTWGALPLEEGGFSAHYQGYPGHWDNERFRLRLSILRGGQWQAGLGPTQALFETLSGSQRPARERTLALNRNDLRRLHRPTPVASEAAFQYDMHSRSGFFKLELADDDTGHAFGHALYPRLLTEVLTRNARQKRPDPLPQEPYTPVLESVSLSYRAHQDIPLDSDAAVSSEDRVLRLTPFGHEVMYPPARQQRPTLLSRFSHDGNLYIGLTGDAPQGLLHLYFQLRSEVAAEPWQERKVALSWAAWCPDGWQALAPHRQLADGTQGFLRAGIVSLDLPSGLSPSCPLFAGQIFAGQLFAPPMYWLRLSAPEGFDLLAGLQSVHANAVTATRVLNASTDASTHASTSDVALPAACVTGPRQSIPGLRSVYQAGPSFGLSPAAPQAQGNSRDALRTATAERLRHKNRASTCADYERLVLERFPILFKAKCIAHERAPQTRGRPGAGLAQASLQPGHVMVVVVPMPQPGTQFDSTQAPRLDACVLDEIACYLRERSSPGAHIVVRNAAYERVQVRCNFTLTRGQHEGAMLRLLNQHIVEYISPWHEHDCTARFDWEVRADRLETYLRGIEGVKSVSQTSLLHIVRTDQNVFALGDTARQTAATGINRVTPAQNWSLVLPTRGHLLSVSDAASGRPIPTGVNKLQVGSTFIISGSAHGK